MVIVCPPGSNRKGVMAMAAKSAAAPRALVHWMGEERVRVDEVQGLPFSDANCTRTNSPCLWAAGMEAGFMTALSHGRGIYGKKRVSSQCPKQLKGMSKRGEGRVSEVVRLNFAKTNDNQLTWELGFCKGAMTP